MSRVLVAYGTKHGATAEIAERIGAVLRESGLHSALAPRRAPAAQAPPPRVRAAG